MIFWISRFFSLGGDSLKTSLTLYKWKKICSDYRVSWYSNRPAQSHGFNPKIGFEKYVPSPKSLPKKCPKSAFQTKPTKFDTFLPISRDSVHIFQNRFLHWNCEIEPVDLNTINPIIRTIFFSPLFSIFKKLRFSGFYIPLSNKIRVAMIRFCIY